MEQLSLDVRLPDQAEFSNFVTGVNGATLAAAILHAAQRDDTVFWLHGGIAVGKSHLLLAACRQVTDAGANAAFLAASSAKDLLPDEISQWGEKDFVAIDDVHRLAGSQRWEAALFQLFNALRDNGNVMMVSAAASPRETAFNLADLASRMSSGLVYKLKALSDNERLDALRVRAQGRGFELPDETGRYLMYRYPRDLSSLFAVLDKLDDASLTAQRRITIPFVKQVLESSNNFEN